LLSELFEPYYKVTHSTVRSQQELTLKLFRIIVVVLFFCWFCGS